MLLNDMVKKIKRTSHRGDQAVTSDQTTLDIISCINDARRDVVTILPLEYLRATSSFPTVQGTDTYSLTSDVEIPIVLHYTLNQHEYIIKKIESEREFYLNIYVANVAQNRPYCYVNMGYDVSKNKQIKVYPTPDAVYTINYSYYKDPTRTDLGASDLSTEFPDFTSYVQDVIWKGGLYYFLKGFDDPLGIAAEKDFEKAKLALNGIENDTSDNEQQFRWDTGKIRFVDPATSIRLI